MTRLDCEYTWPELGILFSGKILKNFPGLIKEKEFIDWFMTRKPVGLLFDYMLVLRCFLINKNFKKKLDHFMVIEGGEGKGKSTLAAQVAAWVVPSFQITDICYTMNQYLERIAEITAERKTTKDYSPRCLVLDEAGLELFSREAMTKSNVNLGKLFFIQRALNILVILCIPNFFFLDTLVRDHRVNTLLIVQTRGIYKAVIGDGIKAVSLGKRKYLSATKVFLKSEWFWHGTFRKGFPKTIDYEAYEVHKLDNIQKVVNKMLLVIKKTEKPAYVSVTDAAKNIGISSKSLKTWLKNNDIEGKKIGQKWFVTQKAYEKLQENPCKDHEPIENYPDCSTHQEIKGAQKAKKEAAEGKTPETLPF